MRTLLFFFCIILSLAPFAQAKDSPEKRACEEALWENSGYGFLDYLRLKRLESMPSTRKNFNKLLPTMAFPNLESAEVTYEICARTTNEDLLFISGMALYSSLSVFSPNNSEAQNWILSEVQTRVCQREPDQPFCSVIMEL